MRRDQRVFISVIGALAIALGALAVLVFTSVGGDEHSVSIDETSTTSTTPTTSRPSTTLAPTTTTLRPITPSTITPGTTSIVPLPTTASTSPATTSPPSTTPATTIPPTTRPTTTVPGHETGITDREIRVAVIADDTAAVDGINAWKRVVNAHGGIARRQLRVDVLRTNGTPDGYAQAVATACQQDFAIVGARSAVDGATTALTGCGIPDLVARAFDPGHQQAPNTFAVIPAKPGVEPVGPFKWLATNVAGCCSQYVLVPKTGTERARTTTLANATKQAGLGEVGRVDVAVDATDADYRAFVTQLGALHATLAWSGLGLDSTVKLRQAATAVGAPGVKAWYCDDRCADPAFATATDAVEDQYVAVSVNSWLTDTSDTLKTYTKATTANSAAPSIAGLESYASGLLFEQVARQVVKVNGNDGLTRVRLIAALRTTTDFTAKGILGATDIGHQRPTGCFALLRVHGHAFVRTFPTTTGQLSCGSQNLQTVSG